MLIPMTTATKPQKSSLTADFSCSIRLPLTSSLQPRPEIQVPNSTAPATRETGRNSSIRCLKLRGPANYCLQNADDSAWLLPIQPEQIDVRSHLQWTHGTHTRRPFA